MVPDEKREGWFLVGILLTNTSDDTIPQFTFKDFVPSTFEVDRESINPRPYSVSVSSAGTTITWKLDLAPKERYVLSYHVRAVSPDARISDLLKVYEISS